MTLVVTEVSERWGCVVIGDSAVTVGKDVLYGAEKIHFSSAANIGFALWGNACLNGVRVDELVSSFVNEMNTSETPRSAGRKLANLLNSYAKKDGRDWEKLRGGAHICGYEGAIPVLFHVHTGAEPPSLQRPFELYEDFPDATDGCHLRNGYYKIFSGLFNSMQLFAVHLAQLGYKWPMESVEDRVSYYSIMVNTVAQTLEAAGRVPSVGGRVSCFAFNRNGMQVDKRIARGTINFCQASASNAEFAENFGDQDCAVPSRGVIGEI